MSVADEFSSYDWKLALFHKFIEPLNPECYEDWVKAAGMAANLWCGSNKGLTYFDEWSQQASNYMGLDDCKCRYMHFSENKGRTHDVSNKTRRRIKREIRAKVCQPPSANPYSKSKGFDASIDSLAPKGAGCDKDGNSLIPLLDDSGTLCGCELILIDGTKRQIKGGRKGVNIVNRYAKNRSIIYVAEGFHTALSISLACDAACAFGAGTSGLEKAGKYIKKMFPNSNIIFISDSGATGERSAAKAAAAVNGSVIVAKYPSGNTPENYDCNDEMQVTGLDALRQRLLSVQQKSRGFSITRFDQLSSAPIEFLIKDLLPAHSINTFIAPSGVGKTFATLMMAFALVNGIDFCGHRIKRKHTVVIVAGEGNRGLRHRIDALFKYHGIDHKGVELYFSSGAANIFSGPEPLIEELRGINNFDLIIFDTLSRNAVGSEENQARDMGLVVNNLEKINDEFNCASLVVHHTPKTDPKQGRGSNALFGAADVEFILESANPRSAKITDVTLSLNKAKDFDPPPPINLHPIPVELDQLDEDGIPITSLVFEEVESLHQLPVRKLGRNQQTLLDSILSVPADNEELRDLNKAFILSGIDNKRKTEVITGLVKAGMIERKGEFCRVV